MPRHLVPTLSRGDLALLARWSLAGALVAGTFGMLHDQLTYSISREYFTRMKFDQFSAFRGNLPPRAFVAVIGFLGTWWFGLIATWLLARAAGPARLGERLPAAWLTLALGTCLGGATGAWAAPRLFLSDPAWCDAATALGVTRLPSFAKVAGIHLGGYTGAALTTFIILVRWKIPRSRTVSTNRRPA